MPIRCYVSEREINTNTSEKIEIWQSADHDYGVLIYVGDFAIDLDLKDAATLAISILEARDIMLNTSFEDEEDADEEEYKMIEYAIKLRRQGSGWRTVAREIKKQLGINVSHVTIMKKVKSVHDETE